MIQPFKETPKLTPLYRWDSKHIQMRVYFVERETEKCYFAIDQTYSSKSVERLYKTDFFGKPIKYDRDSAIDEAIADCNHQLGLYGSILGTLQQMKEHK